MFCFHRNIILLFFIAHSLSFLHGVEKNEEPLFSILEKFCNQAPRTISIHRAPMISFEELHETLKTFIEMHRVPFMEKGSWLIEDDIPSLLWFSLDTFDNETHLHFKPFVEKKVLRPGMRIALWGDLHGGIHALHDSLKILIREKKIDRNLKIIDPHFHMAFLGDYVDRGFYGVEVLYLLMQLKIRNFDRVILVRGNHEDYNVNVWGNFSQELKTKYSDVSNDVRNKLYALYDFLPMALYLGIREKNHVSYIQCCHGGLELGYNPKALLEKKEKVQFEHIHMLMREDEVKKLPTYLQDDILRVGPKRVLKNVKPYSPLTPFPIGLMWSDFLLNSHHVEYMNGRGFIFGQKLTNELLARASGERHTLQSIIRAHQHHGEMLEQLKKNKGVVPLWDEKVYTLFSTPDIPYYNFHYVSFMLLKLGKYYNDLQRRHVWEHVSEGVTSKASFKDKSKSFFEKMRSFFSFNQ